MRCDELLRAGAGLNASGMMVLMLLLIKVLLCSIVSVRWYVLIFRFGKLGLLVLL